MKRLFLFATLTVSLLAGCGDSPAPPVETFPVSVTTSAPTATLAPIVIQSTEAPPPAMFTPGDEALAQINARNEAETFSPQGQKLRKETEKWRREQESDWARQNRDEATVDIAPVAESDNSSDSSSSSGCSSGASAVCSDGSLSYSANRRGTCSHHGGVAQWCN